MFAHAACPLFRPTISSSPPAPAAIRKLAKLNGSISSCIKAIRHSIQFAAAHRPSPGLVQRNPDPPSICGSRPKSGGSSCGLEQSGSRPRPTPRGGIGPSWCKAGTARSRRWVRALRCGKTTKRRASRCSRARWLCGPDSHPAQASGSTPAGKPLFPPAKSLPPKPHMPTQRHGRVACWSPTACTWRISSQNSRVTGAAGYAAIPKWPT